MDAVTALLDELSRQIPTDRAQLLKAKRAAARRAGTPLLRNDALLRRYRDDVLDGSRPANRQLEQVLTLNQVRSRSGVATVTVITEPFPCPGRCVYCPTEARAPKSYLPNEPAVLRALRNDFDPYRQVHSRLLALDQTGHPVDKIELIIKGGTWSFYPDAYQRSFVARCVEAANHYVAEGSRLKAQVSAREAGIPPSAFSLQPSALSDAHRENETAAHRVIGVTIETRPDYITPEEIRRLRELGVTRVELGVQSLEDRILELIVRDHSTAEIRQATALLRNAGFKVAYHLMPNLPGATPDDDVATFRTMFEDPAYRPDTMKIYPCVVTKTAELFDWWKQGRFQPYDDPTLIALLIRLKQLVPPYVRIERVIRDIPSVSIMAGCQFINLREEVHRGLRAQGLRCRCIRCREVRDAVDGSFALVRRDYEASGGRELFLSMEDAEADRLASLLRLRIPPADACPEGFSSLRGAALVRELHTYGQHLPLHDHSGDAVQHRGFGRMLMAEAERIARREFGCARIAVIAGVGVRDYYRKLGYRLEDTYMMKNL